MNNDLQPLSETEIVSRLDDLPGWVFESDKIGKTYEFATFTDAIRFIDGLVDYWNDEIQHHPDITINYTSVRFELTTYDSGSKVTERDITTARKIEDAFQAWTARA